MVTCNPIDCDCTDWKISYEDCSQMENGEWTKSKVRECKEPKYGGDKCSKDPETGDIENGIYICEPGICLARLDITHTHYLY